MATVDTLPERYEVIGLVHASERIAAGYFPTNLLMDALARGRRRPSAPTA